MSKLFTTLAFAAVLLPAGVGAREPEQRFSRDGITYIYRVSPVAGGRQVIEGRQLPGGSSFRLVVRGDRVDGMSGGHPVSFRTPSSPTQVAAR